MGETDRLGDDPIPLRHGHQSRGRGGAGAFEEDGSVGLEEDGVGLIRER